MVTSSGTPNLSKLKGLSRGYTGFNTEGESYNQAGYWVPEASSFEEAPLAYYGYVSAFGTFWGFTRFTNVNIPKNSKIVNAWLTGPNVSVEVANGAQATIFGQAHDNAPLFANPGNLPDAVSLTTANTGSFTSPTIDEQWQYDVTNIVQEIVNRSGWVSGNALAFIYRNDQTAADKLSAVEEPNLFVIWAFTASAAANLPHLVASASGNVSASASATGAATLAHLVASASALHKQIAAGTPALPHLVAAASATQKQIASSAANLPHLVASASGVDTYWTQRTFRFRNDDGSESTATWIAGEGLDVSRDKLIPTRLRLQTTTEGNTPSFGLKLQYRKVGDSTWVDIA